MDASSVGLTALSLAPAALMAAAVALPWARRSAVAPVPWPVFHALGAAALCCAVAALALHWGGAHAAPDGLLPGLAASTPGAWMAVLVQLLGTVIGMASARSLAGEPGQPRYLAAFAAVLAAVHLLLLADHWLVLIAAWAAVGSALQRLLCFYPERAFALLAAHKKRLADRLADVLLLVAAGCAWAEVGSGSLSALWAHAAQGPASPLLQASAVCLVAAVLLRTAVLPVHGWLIQVMEAPTPVSALLHAGVVNLGGFVLLRFAPLLEASAAARWLLVGAGLATAVLAGLVMLTRVSVKVRLAWSTVAQMGFMLLEIGLGLYTLAALHLIGHSLYKAHAFLAASSVVRQARLQALRPSAPPARLGLFMAPLLAGLVVAAIVATAEAAFSAPAWPWWWSAALALAWAPLLWWPAADARAQGLRVLAGGGTLAALTGAALGAHALLPLGVADAPHTTAGLVALAGLAALYAAQVLIECAPERLSTWRRWSYAGFYVDEFFTRLALRLWPARWTPAAHAATGPSRRPTPARA